MTVQTTQDIPDYLSFSLLLQSIGIGLGASEVHGVLVGLLCANAELDDINWLEQAVAEEGCLTEQDERVLNQLQTLYAASRRALASEAFDFTLLLPDDDEVIQLRVEELAHWCQGFVSGLGLGGVQLEALSDADCREALTDLNAIAKVDGEVEASEEAERGYAEVVEFVRVAALLIWESLSADRAGEDDDNAAPSTLH